MNNLAMKQTEEEVKSDLLRMTENFFRQRYDADSRKAARFCQQHNEEYQQLWPNEWMCESCYVAHFHHNEFEGTASEDREGV